MLPETTLNVRQAILISLGNAGKSVLDNVESLFQERIGALSIVHVVTIEGDYTRADDQMEVQQEGSKWHVSLPMGAIPVGAGNQNQPPSSSSASVPPTPSSGHLQPDLSQLRRGGREAMRRWSTELQRLIERVQGQLRTQDNLSALHQRTDLRIAVDEDKGLEIFVVAALDEPFASGAFLDLAYLVDYILSFERGGGFHYQTNAILFLPNYEVASANQEMREADTYAALMELHSYTSRQQYVSGFANRLEFRRSGPPFNRSCYLVETTNEANRSLQNMEQLSAMVAEWLYRYLTSPLSTYLRESGMEIANRAENRATAYSSLGIASFTLPIDAAIEQCGVQLGEEIIQRHLRRQLRGNEHDEPLGSAQTYIGDPIERWLDAAVEDHPEIRAFQVLPQYFDNIALADYEGLRNRLITLFGVQKLNQALPSLRGDMQQQAEQALHRVQEDLPRVVDRILDATPDGGLNRAEIFLKQLGGAMATQERSARDQAKRAHNERNTVGNRIARARAEYQSATQLLRPQSLLGIVLGLLAVIGLLLYGLNIYFRLLPQLELAILGRRLLDFGNTNLLAGMLLLVSHVAILGFAAVSTFNWMTTTKQQYIGYHRARLDSSLRETQQDLRASFFREMQNITNDELVRLTDLRDHLDTLQERLRNEIERPRLLYNALHFPLEESVLTPDDVQRFYREVINSDINGVLGFIQELTRVAPQKERWAGALSTWMGRSVDDLCATIIAFGRNQMERLRRLKSAEQLLVDHLQAPTHTGRIDMISDKAPQDAFGATEPILLEQRRLSNEQIQALRDRADELFRRGRPFLRYDNTQMRADPPVQISLFGTHSDDASATPLNHILNEYYSAIQRVATNDPHTLIAMSARHGLPLYVLGMVRRYRNNYQRHYREKELHTREEHLALPDLFPLPANVLEPRMAVAVGSALKIRGKDTIVEHDAEGYYFIHQEPDQSKVRISLGREKLDACIRLQHNTDDLERLSTQINNVTASQAARSQGNRPVINRLRTYLRDNVAQIEEWEHAMLEEYIQMLGR